MRVLLLTPTQRLPDLTTMFAELAKHVSLDVVRLEKKEQRELKKVLNRIEIGGYDRIILDLPIKNSYSQVRYLSTLKGLLAYDQDACQNYLRNSRWHGKFTKFYRRLPLARILVTGASVAARLRAEGFDASFAPKGYDPAREYLDPDAADIKRRDIELGFIGRTASAAYAGRKEMLERLASVEPLSLLRTEPGDHYRRMLNRIRYFVSADVGLEEYMAKNFEAMACGCVLLAWRQGVEETAIGLQDGEHLLLYSGLDELRDHIARLRGDPVLAQRIADRGREFVEHNLSFAHLAARMAHVLSEVWPDPKPDTGWRRLWNHFRP